jgi:carboxymethylenebutenolidase
MTDHSEHGVTRRGFVRTGLAAGFALAVQPIAEATIHTDSGGLTVAEVSVKAHDGVTVPAYRAMPATGHGPFPVVLVVHEIFGVHEHIKDLCRRLAKRGYFAIAPDLYVRQGDVSQMPMMDIIQKVVAKVPDDQVFADLDATLQYVAAAPEGDVSRAAITGFCWGGRIVWLYAERNPSLKAGAAWYGILSKGFAPGGQNPIDVAPTLLVPVIGFYGGQDANIPKDEVDAMRTALATGKSASEIVFYPDAGHGFNADYRPSYNEKDATDAWKKMLDWFKTHGAA